MHQKTAKELEMELRKMSPEKIGEYLDNNKDELIDDSRCFMEYMNTKIKEKGLLKQEVLLKADT